jgi:hypothetical protein
MKSGRVLLGGIPGDPERRLRDPDSAVQHDPHLGIQQFALRRNHVLQGLGPHDAIHAINIGVGSGYVFMPSSA